MAQWKILGPSVVTIALAYSVSPISAQLRDFGNRLEGTAFRPHAARGYELLGFYAYRQDFPLDDDVSLRLRFFLPANEPVYIEARELTVYKQYRMRPKDKNVSKVPGGWCEFSGWPVSAVLRPNEISADNLGVIIRLKSDAEYAEDLAPAILVDSRQQPPAPIGDYVLYLTINRTLRSLDFEIDGVAGYSRTYKYKEASKNRSVEGGTVIPLRFPAQQIPSGPVTVLIVGTYANDIAAKPVEITYRFFHKPL